MGSLYRAAADGHPHELDDAVVVGTVEDFRPASFSTPLSFDRAIKLVAEATSKKKSAIVRVLGGQPFYAR
jgi:hypothetical protein